MSDGCTRRDVLAGIAAGGATLLASKFQSSWAQAMEVPPSEIATGVVFNDANGNGVRDPGEKGIAGVLVSNGRDIVRTDSEGRYQIPVRDGTMLFIVKPANWKVPLSSLNLPQHYYFHRPNGSPQWRATDVPNIEKMDPQWYFPGSKPTGPLPASIDFALQARAEPDEFKVVVFGDTQVSSIKQLDWMMRDTIPELINAPDVAFGLSLGDVVNVGLLYMFEPVNQVQAKTGFPWYMVPGNHDQNLAVPNDDLGAETFRSIYGPTTYAFEYGPVSFLMLDNVRRRGFTRLEKTDVAPGTGKPASSYYCDLREEHWHFVENYLKTVPRDRQLVICMHQALTGQTKEEKAFAKRFLSLISGRKYTLSISGHTHIQHHTFWGADQGFAGPGEHHHFNSICVRGAGYRGMFDELHIPGCMAFDGTPNGYSFVTFSKTGYSIRYKASRGPEDYQMNLFVSSRIKKTDLARELVRANIFGGSSRSKVRMRVNKEPWRPMELKPQPDPAMEWVIESLRSPQPWLGSPYNTKDKVGNSDHIWQAKLPDGLNEGTHTLEVESIDMFGRIDRAAAVFTVIADTQDAVQTARAMVDVDDPEIC